MSKSWIYVCLAVTFLLEGTLLQWLVPGAWQSKIYVAPHFMLVFVLYIGLYMNRHTALIYGLVIGLFQDFIYYSPMLGPISFSMGLTGYLAGLMHGRVYSSIVVSMMVIAMGNLAYESIIYALYRLFRVTHVELQWVFLHQMLPSMLINLLFALAVYVPLRKYFESLPATTSSEAE
jgi:rod shape-determining protein MreD